jgi:hypothetical protein
MSRWEAELNQSLGGRVKSVAGRQSQISRWEAELNQSLGGRVKSVAGRQS